MAASLCPSDGRAVILARLRRDLSKVFALPTVPSDSPAAPPPPGLQIPLFPYQLRSLACAQRIEAGVELKVASPGGTVTTFRPRGGVIADSVGMGKTAEIVALLLSRPGDVGCLVVTPDHLAIQWRAEIAKFAGNNLRVTVATKVDTLLSKLSAFANEPHDVLVVSLGCLCSNEYRPLIMKPQPAKAMLHALRFHRIILDECHDAITFRGGLAMSRMLSLTAEKLWCVSGTPFPEGDASIKGIHQLLKVNINFVISNSPFCRNEPLPESHPFQRLKRLIYLCNTPRSVGNDVPGKQRLVESAPYILTVTHLKMLSVERAFYEEKARRAGAGDAFGRKFESLRQVCCHPAVSEEWHARLAREGVAGGSKGALISLDDLAKRMVTWKLHDAKRSREKIKTLERQSKAAQAAIGLVAALYPAQVDGLAGTMLGFRKAMDHEALANFFKPFPPRWRVVSGGSVYLDWGERRVTNWARSLEPGEPRAFIDTSAAWLRGRPDERTRLETEIARAERESKYFEEEVVGVLRKEVPSCVICMEEPPNGQVGVLLCGHNGCTLCLEKWLMRAGCCPTCRRPARLTDVQRVDLNAKAALHKLSSDDADGASARATKRPRREFEAKTPPQAARFGSKPAAIVEYCQGVLSSDPESRVIVFSQYDNALRLIATTLAEAGLRAVRLNGSAEARHEQIGRFTKSPLHRILLLSSVNSASGTNLQCADHVVFLEPPGTNARHAVSVETQAIGRTLRIGQNRRVHVQYFLFENSIEDDLYSALERARGREVKASSSNKDTRVVNRDATTSSTSSSSTPPVPMQQRREAAGKDAAAVVEVIDLTGSPVAAASSINPSTSENKNHTSWTCATCTFVNPPAQKSTCLMCATPKLF